jgi:hypothetical protein
MVYVVCWLTFYWLFDRGGCELLLENYAETKEIAEVFSKLKHCRGYLRLLIQHKPQVVLKLFGGLKPDLFGINIKSCFVITGLYCRLSGMDSWKA